LLRKSGNESTAVRYLGMLHGFVSFYREGKAGRDVIAQVAGVLRDKLTTV
jgi:acetyl esterase